MEKFESVQSQHRRSSSRVAAPVEANRHANSGYAFFTRNDSLTWMVQSERRWRRRIASFVFICESGFQLIIDLQNEFRYDFRKGSSQISASTEFTVFTVIKG